MADYSGYVHSTYDHKFYPEKGPSYWYSSKSWSESSTSVPKEYLSYLITLWETHAKKSYQSGSFLKKPNITYKNGWYTLHGYGFWETGDKVRKRFNWKNNCDHSWVQSSRKYMVCLSCSERDCKHETQTLLKVNGVIDPRWACEDCGEITGEHDGGKHDNYTST